MDQDLSTIEAVVANASTTPPPPPTPADVAQAASLPDLTNNELGYNGPPIKFAEKPKEEPKPDDTQPDDSQPAPDDIVGQALNRGRPKRDFTGLDEEEKEIFNGMNRKAYDKLYPLYTKLKPHLDKADQIPTILSEYEKLKSAPPPSAYDHEESYLLANSYREALVERNTYDSIISHWEAQRIAAEKGEPITPLVDNGQGQLVYGQPLQPSPELKVQIDGILNTVRRARDGTVSKLDGIRNDHTAAHQRFKAGLDSLENTLFKPYAAQLKPVADQILAAWPDQIRGRREVQHLANALALLKISFLKDAEQRKVSNIQQVQKTAAKVAGPTASSLTTSPPPSKSSLMDANEEARIRAELGV